jgi:catechol 2,3-dioxygenase-like lactoylglutathione lyase family enzyme
MIDKTKAFSGFSVNDLQKAKDFYGKTLGLEVDTAPMEDALHLKIDGNKIFVYKKDNHVPATFTILNFPVDNVEKTVDELSKKGVQFEHYSGGEIATNEKGIHEEENMKIAWFKDPAGNYLSILEGEV